MTGFGSEKFGFDAWGDGGSGGGGSGPTPVIPATFQRMKAVRENIVRFYFSAPVYFSGLLDANDGSDASHYTVAPVPGTTGKDGFHARPVSVLSAAVGLEPFTIDVTLDRPMSPIPAQYTATIDSGLVDAATRVPVPPGSASGPGLFKELVPPTADVATPSRDVANPSTFSDLVGSTPYAATATLGTFQYDDQGDYANDQGIISYKKRILRGAITLPGGFAHLPGYGIGITNYGKELAKSATRAKIAADWQRQILREPETASATVTSRVDPSNPGLVWFVVKVQTKSGQGVAFRAPVSIGS